ncbi:MAG: response regulator transcription factor, partial [Myxococcota bacterium]
EGYLIEVASTLRQARQWLARHTPDLILLDVMLPDGSGFDLCSELRDDGDLTPVMMLTAKGSPDDIVTGLDRGADDYVTKPFVLKELLGRISAILRRRSWDRRHDIDDKPDTNTLQLGGQLVHFNTRTVENPTTGDRQELTDLELRLLQFFIAHQGRAVAREELLENVWNLSPNTHTRTVDNFLVRLRRLFEPDPANPRHFLTVRGVGYRFEPDPS